MPMMPFDVLFAEIAARECRTITPVGQPDLPSHTFLFTEAYCEEPGCDCRRVMIQVIDAELKKQVATINYGFDPPEASLGDMGQLFLDPLNPQSNLSQALLQVFEETCISDPAYRARLERHYRTWKDVVDHPNHPRHHVLARAIEAAGTRPSEIARLTLSNEGG